MGELISVIVPCYNAQKYISETIESVLSQTYTNWELIVVDDCSTDSSREIVLSYQDRYPNIKLLQTEKNTGTPAEPRNIGINYSKGRYIALLDADDLFFPTKLEEQINFMKDHELDISYTNGYLVNEEGVKQKKLVKAPRADYNFTLQQDVFSSSSVMIKKDILGNVRFRTTIKEDYVFFLELLRNTNIVALNTNSFLYSYRLLPNSRSRKKLKIVYQQWRVLRDYEKLGFFKAFYNFAMYLYRSFKKYYV